MLLAEELEVGLDQVRLEHAPAKRRALRQPDPAVQATGLSASIRAFWMPLRQAGAVGRTLLIAAAAKRWGVDPATCRASTGGHRRGQRRRLGYGDLVDDAAALPVPEPDSVTLKEPEDFTLIGTPAKRLDTPDKVNGRAEYGIDAKLPGMEIAAIAISPVFGGKPKSVDEAAARAVNGVRQVVRHRRRGRRGRRPFWRGQEGAGSAAAIQWDDGPNATLSSADIIRQIEEASKQPGVVARHVGDVDTGARRRSAADRRRSTKCPSSPTRRWSR